MTVCGDFRADDDRNMVEAAALESAGGGLLAAVLESSQHRALLHGSDRGAVRRRRVLQQEIDRRAVLDDAELDRNSPVVEPDFPACNAFYDEVSGGDQVAIYGNLAVVPPETCTLMISPVSVKIMSFTGALEDKRVGGEAGCGTGE